MSITAHRIWNEVAPYLQAQMKSDTGKYGMTCDAVYVVGEPEELSEKLLRVKLPCVRCQAVISPFRRRKRQSDDNRPHPKRIYLTSTCSPTVPGSEGCCKSTFSSGEKQLIYLKLLEKYPCAILLPKIPRKMRVV